MESLSEEQLKKTIDTIKTFKKMIAEIGSKEAVVSHLVNETGLTKEECEAAFDIYNNIRLADEVQTICEIEKIQIIKVIIKNY